MSLLRGMWAWRFDVLGTLGCALVIGVVTSVDLRAGLALVGVLLIAGAILGASMATRKR